MRLNIVTIHAMHNPGSVLQAYALQTYLSQFVETRVVDYRPEYFYSEGSKAKLLAKRILFGAAYKSRAQKFNDFIDNELVLTDRFEDSDSLRKLATDGEVFVAGSDQLWNRDYPCGSDPSFYLEFAGDCRKLSYSTSVGKSIINPTDMAFLKAHLQSFDSLSVRERSTALALSEGLGRDVEWVCDPVLLLDAEHYERFITKPSFASTPYVTVYLSGASDTLNDLVDFYRMQGLKVVLAGGFTKRCYCDIHIKDMGPKDFLSLIRYSEAVVSSSFHATAFCHLFHKDFVTILPESNGERIVSLLDQSGLSCRGILEGQGVSRLSQIANWTSVDAKLSAHVDSSKSYLNKCIALLQA